MPSLVNEFQPPDSEDLIDLYSLVSINGFLPPGEPLKRLPRAYYQPWERILDNLPTLLKQKTLRGEIDTLNILATSRLDTEPEWQRAYLILCFLTHGYIWGSDTPSEVLPPCLTVPLLQVSNHLDLPPVATYAAFNLWNFSSSAGRDFTDVDKLEALHTFTGTEDESWFFVLSVAIEARGARIIPTMLRAIDAVKHEDYETVTRALDDMAACIMQVTPLLDRMIERCDPMLFYHHIRPFLAGSKNMAAAGLPNGVFYDEGDGIGKWQRFRGGSNGQSSLLQFFDLVLGVDHALTSHHKTPKGNSGAPEKAAAGDLSFYEEVRLYMPKPHREFLARVSRMDKIKDFVHPAPAPAFPSPAQKRLSQAYQNATAALGDMRQAHIQMVTRYIIVPSRRPAPPSSAGVNLATTSMRSSKGPAKDLTGTGGTDLIPFLKTARDDTYRAGLAVASRDISITRLYTAKNCPQRDVRPESAEEQRAHFLRRTD
ncbi:Indoleamine 2,3-dioxygenase [Nemania sp. NC0429]|nr:Indoleamine 2,3-dioxygenase [Nemania sp. NC0429]